MAFGSGSLSFRNGRNSTKNANTSSRTGVRFWTILAIMILYYCHFFWSTMPVPTDYSVPRMFNSRTIDYEKACDNPLGDNVKSAWKMIDRTLSENYPTARVSGGIFLYPRQASLLTTLIGVITTQIGNRQVTLCETGFGSGHSLALFGYASAKLPMRILSFDKFDRPYQLELWKTLNATIFQNLSLRYVAGNSCKSVPTTLSEDDVKCDILHGSSLCESDNIDLVEHSPCGTLLTSTAMGSLNDKAVYFGRNAQWRKLRDRGCITEPVCFQEAPVHLERTFVFGKEGESFTSVFCIAMVTGTCSIQQSSCRSDLYSAVATIGLNGLCPRYQIPVPL